LERLDLDRLAKVWSLTLLLRGKSKYKKSTPKLIVSKKERKKIIGEYHTDKNLIMVWIKPHSNFRHLTRTILHEYTHYLQHPSWYYRYMKKYGYKSNPYEIEANKSEKMYSSLIKMTSDKKWRLLIKRNKKLSRIYETSLKMINIH